MNYGALIAFSSTLVALGAIFWVTNRSVRGADRDAPLLRRYAAFEAEENSLLVPVFLVLGVVGLVIGVVGTLLS